MGKAPGFHAGLRFAKDPAQEVGGLPCACRSCRAALLAASSRHAALLATRSRRAALLATPLAPSLAGRLKNRARCRIWRIAVWGIPRVAAKLGREALLARGRLTKSQFRHREKPQFRRRPCNARAFPNVGTPKLATRAIPQTSAGQNSPRARFLKRVPAQPRHAPASSNGVFIRASNDAARTIAAGRFSRQPSFSAERWRGPGRAAARLLWLRRLCSWQQPVDLDRRDAVKASCKLAESFVSNFFKSSGVSPARARSVVIWRSFCHI